MNDVKLGESKPLDSHLRPIKIGGVRSTLSIAERNAKINGDLYVTGEIRGKTDISIPQLFLCL